MLASCVRYGILIAMIGLTVGAAPSRALADAPQGADAVALASKVEVAWQPVSGAGAYNVYRGATATTVTTAVTPSGGTTATTFTATPRSSTGRPTTTPYALSWAASNPRTPRSYGDTGSPELHQPEPDRGRELLPGQHRVQGYERARDAERNRGLRRGSKHQQGRAGRAEGQLERAVQAGHLPNGLVRGSEGRMLSAVVNLPASPQPACATANTGLVDCANWSTSYTLTTTSSWVSGVYILHLVRTDNNSDTQILLSSATTCATQL